MILSANKLYFVLIQNILFFKSTKRYLIILIVVDFCRKTLYESNEIFKNCSDSNYIICKIAGLCLYIFIRIDLNYKENFAFALSGILVQKS